MSSPPCPPWRDNFRVDVRPRHPGLRHPGLGHVIVTSCCHFNNKQEAATELSPFMSGLGQGFCNRLWCDGKQILDAGFWILDETPAQIRNPESVWMDHLCINPLVTIKEIRRVTGVSDATAGRLVKKMADGMLRNRWTVWIGMAGRNKSQ